MLGSFIFDKWFVVRTKDFSEETHAQLRKEDSYESQPEYYALKRLAKIGRDTRAERISQRGEEEMERAGEFDQLTISNFGLTIDV